MPAEKCEVKDRWDDYHSLCVDIFFDSCFSMQRS